MRKKLLSLLTLLLAVCSGAWAYDTYTLTLNGEASQSGSFFTVATGGGFNTKYAGTYDGTSYSKGLKLNSSSSITFTSLAKSNITIVQSTSSNGTNKFKLGGTAINHAASGSITIGGQSVSYTMTENTTNKYLEFVFTGVPATSSLAITNDGETGIFYVKVAYTESAKTQLTAPEISVAPATGTVTLGSVTNATKVTYTTDGTAPTESSDTYSAPFVVTDGTVVKAIAIGDGESYSNSDVASQQILLTGITIEDPIVNQFNGTVAITCASPNATIEYSTDGGSSWNTYTRAFTLTTNTDIKARARRASCTTSADVDATINAVAANFKTKTIVMGYGAFDKTSDKELTGKENDVAKGYTLTMLTEQNKAWSERTQITISEIGATRKTFGGSNGVQSRLDLPAGVKATQLRLYSYVNNATSATNCAWKEVNGENLNSTLNIVPMGAFTDVADYNTNPDVRIFPLDNAEGSITFTNGGLQTFFVIVLDVIEPVSTTIASSGYSSFASSYPVDCANLPDGLEAYQVTATSEAAGTATLEKVTTAVTAGTGLILKGTADASYDIPVVAAGNDISATNLLTGVIENTDIPADSYILKNGQFVKSTAGTLPAGKAYLTSSSIGEAPIFNLIFGDQSTGIESVSASQFATNSIYYNLNGQRVAKPAKGLFIVNGKKVIIK